MSSWAWVYPGYPLGAAGIGCHDDCLPQPEHTRIYQKSGEIGCLTYLQPSEPKLLMISHHIPCCVIIARQDALYYLN
jgi:hypothetical protein